MCKIGDKVSAHHPRGGRIVGRIVKRERISGYGPRFVLDTGHSIAAADIVARLGGSECLERLGRAGFCDGEHKAHAIRASIRDGLTRAFACVRVLSIDAWRDGDGWTWNDWRAVGWFPLALIDLAPRAMLREMRARGYLSAASAGRVAVADDGSYNIEFCDRSTGEPLYAIEYGSLQA